MRLAGIEKYALGRSGLTGVDVGDNTDIPVLVERVLAGH
jgi:hypothetical protein